MRINLYTIADSFDLTKAKGRYKTHGDTGIPLGRIPSTEIYIGDCREVLSALHEKSVDLIFADPPFNWDVPYGEWDDSRPWQEYLTFTHEWLDACLRVLNDHGSFWVNIPDDTAAEIRRPLETTRAWR